MLKPHPAPATQGQRAGDEVAREIGRFLRARRLRRGEELAWAAERLGIEPDYLALLEGGGFDHRAVPPYIVALLRAYADRLGLDGGALAAILRVRSPPGAARRGPGRRGWAAEAASLLGGASAAAGLRLPPRVARALSTVRDSCGAAARAVAEGLSHRLRIGGRPPGSGGRTGG